MHDDFYDEQQLDDMAAREQWEHEMQELDAAGAGDAGELELALSCGWDQFCGMTPTEFLATLPDEYIYPARCRRCDCYANRTYGNVCGSCADELADLHAAHDAAADYAAMLDDCPF